MATEINAANAVVDSLVESIVSPSSFLVLAAIAVLDLEVECLLRNAKARWLFVE
jgi:hypothetical protein